MENFNLPQIIKVLYGLSKLNGEQKGNLVEPVATPIENQNNRAQHNVLCDVILRHEKLSNKIHNRGG